MSITITSGTKLPITAVPTNRHLQRTELQALDHFALAAERTSREVLHLEAARREPVELFFEALGAGAMRSGDRRRIADLDGGRVRG
jgi:hypothetical protein